MPGGIRLITEQLPGNLSTSVGFWFGVGSRDEQVGKGGVSHFLEHLLFKGTTARTALEIAETFDSVGAVSNAATSKEATYYWSHMVASDLPYLLPVLTDMVTDSVLADRDIEVERGVILEELAMADDTPTDVVAEAYARAVFGGDPLGRPIGGTRQSVLSLRGPAIRELYKSRYTPQDLVVAVAGAVDHDQVAELLMEGLERSPWADELGQTKPSPTRNLHVEEPSLMRLPDSGGRQEGLAEELERSILMHRDIEQAHIITGAQWMGALDPRLPASAVTLNLLGGGMSSRLFQEIREKRGLAYTTQAYSSAYFDTGYFGLYSGCSPTHLKEVETLMWGEVETLASDGPTEAEMARTKGQIRGAITLNLEDSGSRMTRLARSEMVGRLVTLEDAVRRVEAVEAQDVKDVAAAMIESARATAVVTANG